MPLSVFQIIHMLLFQCNTEIINLRDLLPVLCNEYNGKDLKQAHCLYKLSKY